MKESENVEDYFAPIGKISTKILLLCIVALLGPLAIAPRCIVVAHSGLKLLFTDLPIWLFSILFCLITAFFANRGKIVEDIGKYLTPIMLIGIFVTVIASFIKGPSLVVTKSDILSVLSMGFYQGYQTMDLAGATYFATQVAASFSYIQNAHERFKTTIGASFLAAILLGITYVAFVIMGSMFHDLSPKDQGGIFIAIAIEVLGEIASTIVAIVITLACLTTFIALIDMSANFLQKNTPLCRKSSIFLVLFGAFCFSMYSFDQICVYLSYPLQIMYPAMMAYTASHLFLRWIDLRAVSFYSTLLISILFYIHQLISLI